MLIFHRFTSYCSGAKSKEGLQHSCEAEPLVFSYYRTWCDVAMKQRAEDLPNKKNYTALTDIPRGVNMVSLFHVKENSPSDEEFLEAFKTKYQPELKTVEQKLFALSLPKYFLTKLQIFCSQPCHR
ncbi:hypothetical protein CDCE8392_2085 [Corynebacterium diphtheriae CDCE 8392]|nr:hypothetical protein CDCE8392_2085 [Corynebacterium diphtheriae CDCE 8392]MBG9357409.1 hypothetical protein [Corynebacterium diphtheriae bv. mitis]MBG9370982.1 hypothetical protein [Corynebacterium diphtheriae bv. mitis]OFI53168.1 hypothetical protein BKD83_03960 [Corynebacterium diphtheriae]OSQ20756.1 hypothetical protein B1A52_05745 [Corynebacterium diphtheriae]